MRLRVKPGMRNGHDGKWCNRVPSANNITIYVKCVINCYYYYKDENGYQSF